ncbi:hypothetical protein M011DRAFT_287949 [Sporormia fimetaria CBS 119925]|uniref:Uncharacterized protein n=1 Tax=Sporormia fimetaria CBS 119925 TaxID=1340428 RepID=A0A6A6UVQ7_9PLEO|nr:hypothetical protein M011DRAFT_287949 [Sporormia fimetaria CBS 119925]
MYFSNSRNVSRQFLIESTLFSSLFTAVFSAPLTITLKVLIARSYGTRLLYGFLYGEQ